MPTSRIGRENSSKKVSSREFKCAEHISTGNSLAAPRRVGFYAHFLKSNPNRVANDIYKLWLGCLLTQPVVLVQREGSPVCRNRNQSTTDGTKVAGRAGRRLNTPGVSFYAAISEPASGCLEVSANP